MQCRMSVFEGSGQDFTMANKGKKGKTLFPVYSSIEDAI